MKKIVVMMICVVLVLSLVGCTGGPSKEEIAAMQAENESLKAELVSKSSALDSMTSERDSISSKVSELESQLATLTAEAEAKTQGSVVEAEKGIQLYDDEYVTISYLGCETGGWSGPEIVFYAINKTNNDLTFQADSLAIDGESLGHVSGSDTIAAQGKGKFKYSTKEEFPTMTPSTISGTIKVIDFEKTLFDKMSYDVKFVNVSVA